MNVMLAFVPEQSLSVAHSQQEQFSAESLQSAPNLELQEFSGILPNIPDRIFPSIFPYRFIIIKILISQMLES